MCMYYIKDIFYFLILTPFATIQIYTCTRYLIVGGSEADVILGSLRYQKWQLLEVFNLQFTYPGYLDQFHIENHLLHVLIVQNID